VSSVHLDVVVESPLWAGLPEAEALAEAALAAAERVAAVRLAPGAEVSLLLADDARLRALNAAWRGKDRPTNVLSFPAGGRGRLDRAPVLGDIAIAFETLCAEAGAEGKSRADHFSHLVVHGFLHLIGYDHETPDEAEEMESLETAILAGLGIADPYSGGVLVERGPATIPREP
jgi:probable rRNA maturation factor